MIYYLNHCLSLYVYPGEIYILESSGHDFGKKLSIWLYACSVLIMVPLLYVRLSFPLVS